MRRLLLICCLMALINTLYAGSPAQDSTISGRQKDSVRAATTGLKATDSMYTEPSRDSVIVDTTALSKAPMSLERFSVLDFVKRHPYYKALEMPQRLPQLERNPVSKDWIFYFFAAMVFFLALLRLSFPKYFADIFKVFFNTSLRQKQLREQLVQEPLPSLLMNIFFVISSGIFLFLLASHKQLLSGYDIRLALGGCVLLIASVYLAKFTLVRLFGWIFGKREATDAYLFVVFMVNKIAGMVLLPFSFLLAYANQEEAAALVFLAYLALAILAIYRLVRSFQAIHKPLRINQLQFLIFVAAFEVVPILLLYKGLNSLF